MAERRQQAADWTRRPRSGSPRACRPSRRRGPGEVQVKEATRPRSRRTAWRRPGRARDAAVPREGRGGAGDGPGPSRTLDLEAEARSGEIAASVHRQKLEADATGSRRGKAIKARGRRGGREEDARPRPGLPTRPRRWPRWTTPPASTRSTGCGWRRRRRSGSPTSTPAARWPRRRPGAGRPAWKGQHRHRRRRQRVLRQVRQARSRRQEASTASSSTPTSAQGARRAVAERRRASLTEDLTRLVGVDQTPTTCKNLTAVRAARCSAAVEAGRRRGARRPRELLDERRTPRRRRRRRPRGSARHSEPGRPRSDRTRDRGRPRRRPRRAGRGHLRGAPRPARRAGHGAGPAAEALNARRLEVFGGTELRLLGTERIRTENNCVAARHRRGRRAACCSATTCSSG